MYKRLPSLPCLPTRVVLMVETLKNVVYFLMMLCWGTLKSSHLSTDNFRPDSVVILSLVSVCFFSLFQKWLIEHWRTMWDIELNYLSWPHIRTIRSCYHKRKSFSFQTVFVSMCHLYIFAKWSVGDFSSAFPFPVLHLSRMHNSLCPFFFIFGLCFSKPRRVPSLVHDAYLRSRILKFPTK